MSEVNLHGTMDARIWADEFNRVLVSKNEQPYDPGWLIGWFANAIMCGHDHASRKLESDLKAALKEKDEQYQSFQRWKKDYFTDLKAAREALQKLSGPCGNFENIQAIAKEALNSEDKDGR